MTPTNDPAEERWRCVVSPLYFILNYCMIYDGESKSWIKFVLWKEQIAALKLFCDFQKVIALKARQLGLSWLALAYALWQMLFQPIATVLIFSKDEDSSIYLLGDERLRGMYHKLPDFLKATSTPIDRAKTFALSNGSTARAFAKTGGDSYTATLAIIDEADVVPDLNGMMRSIKPTVDAGGKLFLISRVDKAKPESEFKRIYKAAKRGETDWAAIFLAWFVRPERTQEWYLREAQECLRRTGSLDDMHEQYPATEGEALAPLSLDKRILAEWLNQCFTEEQGIELPNAPAIPGLVIYRAPDKNKQYDLGVDSAEGNPTSDDSAITVLCRDTGEEVAKLRGKLQPSTLAAHANKIGIYFNNAGLMIERNNHGHAVLLWLRDNSKLEILKGHDDKEGWLSNSKGKALMYDDAADAFRDEETTLHSFDTWDQLVSIEGSSLRASSGQMDDLADSYALSIQGTKAKHKKRERMRVTARGFHE